MADKFTSMLYTESRDIGGQTVVLHALKNSWKCPPIPLHKRICYNDRTHRWISRARTRVENVCTAFSGMLAARQINIEWSSEIQESEILDFTQISYPIKCERRSLLLRQKKKKVLRIVIERSTFPTRTPPLSRNVLAFFANNQSVFNDRSNRNEVQKKILSIVIERSTFPIRKKSLWDRYNDPSPLCPTTVSRFSQKLQHFLIIERIERKNKKRERGEREVLPGKL